eukprot:Colp12_sorted_trinity150504_noHs@12287
MTALVLGSIKLKSSRMDSEEVAAWLTKIGFPEFVQIFRDNHIDYEVLLVMNHELLKELGVDSVGKRVKLLAEIDRLRSSRTREVGGVKKILSEESGVKRKFDEIEESAPTTPSPMPSIESPAKRVKVEQTGDVKKMSPITNGPSSYTAQIRNMVEKHGESIVNAVDKQGFAFIHYAAAIGDVEAIHVLLAHNCNVNIREVNGNTALHWAVLNNNVKVIQHLLPAGAKVELRNRGGMCPVDWAIQCNNEVVFDMLVNHLAKQGESGKLLSVALLEACVFGNISMVVKLLQKGASPNHRGFLGATPAIVAAKLGHTAILRQLISAGADLTLADAAGWTCLHWAVSSDNMKAVQLLVSSAPLVDLKNKRGETALALAQREKRDDISKFLSMLSMGNWYITSQKTVKCEDEVTKELARNLLLLRSGCGAH